MGNSLVEGKERGMVFLRQDKRNHIVKKEEKHMRAAVYYAPDDLRMEDMETPEETGLKANPDRTSGFPVRYWPKTMSRDSMKAGVWMNRKRNI